MSAGTSALFRASVVSPTERGWSSVVVCIFGYLFGLLSMPTDKSVVPNTKPCSLPDISKDYIMTVWKLMDDRNYESIISFVGMTALICLTLPAFYILDKSFDSLLDVRHLFADNSNYFISFLIAYFFVLIATLSNYSKTLGTCEAETDGTPKAAMKNVSIWIFFWTAWSIFCCYLTITQQPLTQLVCITLLVLTILPGFT